MRRLRKFLQLSDNDRRLLLSAAVLLNGIRLGLWLLPFQSLCRLLATLMPVIPPPPLAGESIAKDVIWAIEVTSYYSPGGVKCLARALTTQVLLGRQGYSTDLRIGVAKSATGQLEAHAWVESQGKIIVGALEDLKRYAPLSSLEGQRP